MRRVVGWIALLAWLTAPCLWWLSQQQVPRATALRDVDGRADQWFSSDGRLFVCGDAEQIRVYDVVEGVRLATWPRPSRFMDQILGFVNGHALALCYDGDKVQIVDLITGKTVAAFSPEPGSSIRLAPNGKVAASVHDNRTVRIWDLNTGQSFSPLTLPEATIVSASFSPDNARLAIAVNSGGSVRVIDVATGDIEVCQNSINHGSMALFTPDGRLVGLEITANEMNLWDLTNDRLLVRGPRGGAGFRGSGSVWVTNHAPASPFATLAEQLGLTTASDTIHRVGAGAQIFDTKTGQMIGSAPPLSVCEMLPDGKTLATYSFEDDSVVLWDVPPYTRVHPLLAWAVLGLAIVLSGWWWRLRRRARASSTPAYASTTSEPAMDSRKTG